MRLFLLALLAAGLTGCATSRSKTIDTVDIQDIRPRLIEAHEFKRIGEYLSGKEVTGGRLILRSDPNARSGCYFVLTLDEKVRRLAKGTTIRGEIYTARSPDAQVFEMPLPNQRPKTKEVFFGLTGEDWSAGSPVPGAWRFSILSPNGEVMAQQQSYLWEL
ncbi:MAG: hypothetical protein ACLFU4_10265 [Opitutales bacterium]